MMTKIKRPIRILIILFALYLAVAFCSATAFAAEKYLISEGTHIDITLNSDGSAVVCETWNYYYGGDNITRMGRTYLGGDYTLTDFEVYLDGNELTVLDSPRDDRPVGFAAVIKQEDGSTKVDTYLDAFNESHQVTICYVVLNAVTVYNDVADFKWNLTSNAEPTRISELTADIHIPYGTEDGGLLMWAHGPSTGSFLPISDDDGIVSDLQLGVTDVPDTMAVAVRLAMPPQLFSESDNTVSEDKLDEIIEYESKYEKISGSKEIERKLLLGSAVPAIVGFLLIIAGSLLNKQVTQYRLKKMRHDVGSLPKYIRSLPDGLSPALVKRLVMIYPIENKATASEADGQFAVTLLDLVERGFVKTDTSQESVAFSLSQSDRESLTEYEKDVIEILETASQGQASISLDQLNGYFKDNMSWMSEKKADFKMHMDEAWKKLGFEEEQTPVSFPTGKLTLWCMLGGIVLLGVLILLNMNRLAFAGNGVFFAEVGILYPVAMFFFALGAGSFFPLFVDTLPILTEQGEKEYSMWQAFARFLDDFSTLEEREMTDPAVWRRYLVYAAAIGRSKKLKNQLQVKYPDAYRETEINDHWYYNMLESQVFGGMDTKGGFTLPKGDYDGGSGGDFSSDAGGYDSGSGGGDFD